MEEEHSIEQPIEEFVPGYKTIEEFTKNGFSVLMESIKASNNLPSEGDWNFYNNAHEAFGRLITDENSKIISCMNRILTKYEVDGSMKTRSLEEKEELLVEANDVILEKAANNIDEMNGIKRNPNEPVLVPTPTAPAAINGSWNASRNRATFSVSSVATEQNTQKAIHLTAAKNIAKPQIGFKDKVDNSNNPWEPRIKDKPNSLKPLAIFLEETENGEEFSHPYEFELEKFTPSENHVKEVKPEWPKPLEETPLIEVTDEEGLKKLLQDLMNYDEIAVDLEHHSYRTFMGITCLMQISTKDTDYIVDTLSLRNNLWILNEVFTKPSVVKIFHGADYDIQWLQRDLSLYVVNMFDTHIASKMLQYSGLSLAYLLQRFCNVKANKHFQLADWRIRPLPDELKNYAREDVHYLIYIYHCLKQELLKKANGSDTLLKAVFQQSTEKCKKRYLKPRFHDESYLEFYNKCKRFFDNRQLFALKGLYSWRDKLAREEDESFGYILPNHMMLQICEALPREMQGILACCNPIPPFVRTNLLHLHKIILNAREQPVERLILNEDNRDRGTTKSFSKINMDSLLHCPHDLSKSREFRDDLPVLLSAKSVQKVEGDCGPFEKQTRISVFSLQNSVKNNKELKKLKFLGPFDRYKLIKPFVQAQEGKVAAERQKQEEEINLESRIAAVHEHFMKEIKDKPQIQPHNSDGPNKRKREEDEDKEDLRESLRMKKQKSTNSQLSIVDRGKSLEETKMKEANQSRKKQKLKKFKGAPYDYSQVDFTKFQGGSVQHNKTTQVKSHFKSQGKRKFKGKQQTKSMTFGRSANK